MPARKRTASASAAQGEPARRSRRTAADQTSKYFDGGETDGRDDDEGDDTAEPAPKRARGRPKSTPDVNPPKKAATKSAPTKTPAKEPAAKPAPDRKPGRPGRPPRAKKAATPVPAPESESENDEAKMEDEDDYQDEQEKERDATPEPAPKRPRGRPAANTNTKTKPKPKPVPDKKKPAKPARGDGLSKAKQTAATESTSESDDDDDDDGPQIEIVPLEQLRPDGGVAYADDRLHKNTLLFLKDLKANNKRTWLKAHDGEFRRALGDWHSFAETLSAKVIRVDDTIPELPAKDVIFRIYRDTRFTKDPTPYKTNFSAAWSRTGRKGPYAIYYAHCEPGGDSFLAGGLWMPAKEALARLRTSIDMRPDAWRRVLSQDAVRDEFLAGKGGSGTKDGQEAALRAFTKHSRMGALKTRPQGYIADHSDIELLKLKSFILRKSISDDLFTTKGGQGRIAAIFGAMSGFVSFLNSIVMPDPEADDEGEEEEDGGDEEEDGNEEEEEDEEEEE